MILYREREREASVDLLDSFLLGDLLGSHQSK